MRKIAFILSSLLLFILSLSSKFALTPYTFPQPKFFPKMPVAAKNPVTVEGAKLGRYLFYDPVLSSDSTMSCASCHNQKYAFSDSPNSFSKGRNGIMMKRNTMALFNLAWYPAFFWDGRATSIEEQVFHPVREYNEMNLNWQTAAKRLRKNKFYKTQFKEVFGSSQIDSVQMSFAIVRTTNGGRSVRRIYFPTLRSLEIKPRVPYLICLRPSSLAEPLRSRRVASS